jgi:putative nucleotidyltransferase with HDIG domain
MKTVIKQIADMIIGTEFENKTYIVGGFVRDKLLNISNEDLDIVVEIPKGGRKLAKYLYEKKLCSKPVIFDNFGTAFVMFNEHKIEFVMTRKEAYRDKNRKPDVLFGTLKEDVFRRDFTINSLVMDIISQQILDISGKGISDLKDKLIRSTSNPEIIFGEDPLRMLRAVRFAIRLGFQIEKKTSEGIIGNAEKLQHISWERRRDELTKMLISQQPAKAIKMLCNFGLMKNIIPELEELKGLKQGKYHHLDAFEHTLLAMQNTPSDLILRLATLLHDIGKPTAFTQTENEIHFYGHEHIGAKKAVKILKRLKFSSSQIGEIKFLIENHMRLKSFGNNAEKLTDKALRKLIFQSEEKLEPLLNLIHADNLAHSPQYNLPNQISSVRKKINLLQKNEEKKMPISGQDIMNYFEIQSGKKIGRLLNKAQEIWFENPELKKDEILKLLNRS